MFVRRLTGRAVYQTLGICYAIRVRWLSLATLLLFACTSAPPPRSPPAVKDGKRQRPLTPEEAEKQLQALAPRFGACYRSERLNLAEAYSSYVFQVWIPNDGSPVDVEVIKDTIPKQATLRNCLEVILEAQRFTPHTGEAMTLRVPIEGPS